MKAGPPKSIDEHIARFFILAAFAGLMLVELGCGRQPSALPLSLATVRQLSPANTAQISFEERGGEVLVTVTDQHGDAHIHRLIYDGAAKAEALGVLQQKQKELEMRP